ncbi:uncharacterized protein LOC124170148 isoform X2 [Ischnura elegans]|uniref:uncharacterized protein LOC124170148 isoform X2 n=1 Tax=Ischnura elegans TaxID=197161 RepID=UPI001ED887E4|nr:uncharacterized protein LOC124170148 isoform X2 [Ischnura elegans]
METPVLGYGPNVGESHICRLCMKSHAYYLNVFVSSEQFKMPIGKVIEDLLMLEVAEGDSLPATVCCPCVTKLMDFREFKEMCVYSARELSRSEPFPCPVKVEIIEEDDTVEPCAGSGLADWNDEFIKDGSGQPVHSKGRIADHENDGADGNGEDDGNDDTRGVVVKKEYNERATVFIESAAVAMREECLVDEEDVERGADDGVVQSVVVKREYGDGATVFIESAAVEMRDEFVVVKFQGEDVDGVEFFAAPTKWIHFSEKDGPPTAKEEVQIYWPPQSTPPNLVTKMARKETGPQSDWTLHSAILKRYYASYPEARQGARLAGETSNLESDECGKRRRHRKRRYDESSSEEDEYSHNSKKVKPPPHFLDKEIAVPKYHMKKADNNQPSTSTASGRRKAESTIQKTGIGCSNKRKGESMENDEPVNAKRQKIRSSDFQTFSGEDASAEEIGGNDTGQPLQNVDDLQGTLDVVLRELGSQRKMISLLNSKMDILVVNQAQTNRTLTPALKRVERPPNLPPFPVTSHAKLEKVERFLDNKSNFAATVQFC